MILTKEILEVIAQNRPGSSVILFWLTFKICYNAFDTVENSHFNHKS